MSCEESKIRLQKSNQRTKRLMWAAVTVETVKTALIIALVVQSFAGG